MDNEKEYFSVAVISNITGRTIQSIYKRIRNKTDRIQEFLKEDEAGNYIIHKEALKVIYNIDYENISNEGLEDKEESSVQFSKKYNKPKEEANNTVELLLKEQIELLKNQMEEQKEAIKNKDKLIFELNERLAESQRMIDQQQKLSIADKKQILLLEEKAGESTNKQKNKGVFSKLTSLFKGKEITENE